MRIEVSVKGEIVIPAQLRAKNGMAHGDVVDGRDAAGKSPGRRCVREFGVLAYFGDGPVADMRGQLSEWARYGTIRLLLS